MAVGLSAVNLANVWLNVLRGVNATAPAAVYVKLHTGDPGASGTANASAVTTRAAITWSAASGGSISITGTNPSWSMTTSETISHISLWDASTAGNFLDSIALTSSQAVVNGNTLTLTSCTISLGTIAA